MINLCLEYAKKLENIRNLSVDLAKSYSSFQIPTSTPPGYFESITNQRQFFEQLAKKLSINNWEEWYHVPSKTLAATGAS